MNKVYCPLINFKLVKEFETEFQIIHIDENVKIVSNENVPEWGLGLIKYYLPEYQFEEYKFTPYWLNINGDFTIKYFKTQVISFQLALWISVQMKIQIPFLTDFRDLRISYLNRFKYLRKGLVYKLEAQKIEKIKKYYSEILEIYHNHKRLNSAMIFTFDSCISINWDVAFILFVTTFESLLTHNNNWRIKRQLAWAYAIITEKTDVNRQRVFEDFKEIYKIRSEILHGESFKDKYGNGKINLENLAKCRDMLKRLWQVILESKEIIENLSGNNNKRREYFKRISKGWMPEEKKSKNLKFNNEAY